jgi:uncharacterized protein (DUF2236 family)
MIAANNPAMEYFVPEGSIVRTIWRKSDTLLFVFAGAAAEFALNKSVDWLYFTGRLPKDPLGRLFSTVGYAQKIVFATTGAAHHVIDQIATIHKEVEAARGARIPAWAYRDVLFMLIDYYIRSFELLERKLTNSEKAEVFAVFYEVGARMGLEGLPHDHHAWEIMREEHLQQDLLFSEFTKDLFEQYKKHLGGARYRLLRQVQAILVPERVCHLLSLEKKRWLALLLRVYKNIGTIRIRHLLRDVLLPSKYKVQIRNLDR